MQFDLSAAKMQHFKTTNMEEIIEIGISKVFKELEGFATEQKRLGRLQVLLELDGEIDDIIKRSKQTPVSVDDADFARGHNEALILTRELISKRIGNL